MGETVEAEYLAEVVEPCARIETDGWPVLNGDAGREIASAIRHAFGRDEIAV